MIGMAGSCWDRVASAVFLTSFLHLAPVQTVDLSHGSLFLSCSFSPQSISAPLLVLHGLVSIMLPELLSLGLLLISLFSLAVYWHLLAEKVREGSEKDPLSNEGMVERRAGCSTGLWVLESLINLEFLALIKIRHVLVFGMLIPSPSGLVHRSILLTCPSGGDLLGTPCPPTQHCPGELSVMLEMFSITLTVPHTRH